MLEWVLGHSPQGAASHSQTGETTEVGIDCGKGLEQQPQRHHTTARGLERRYPAPPGLLVRNARADGIIGIGGV